MRKVCLYFLLLTIAVMPQVKRAMTVEDLWNMKRVGTFDLSPDGKKIAFGVTTYSMDANKGNSDIYMVNTDGSEFKYVVASEKNETSPKFTPDGKHMAYIKDDQIWICALDGTNAQQLTNISTGVNDFVWSPANDKILFSSSVYPDCKDDAANKSRDSIKDASKMKGVMFDHLMYRHWNEWRNGKRSHLFLFDIATKSSVDIISGMENDAPPLALGSAKDYAYSPNGNEFAFTMNPTSTVSNSTNNEIYTVQCSDVKAGTDIPRRLISTSPGNDNEPVYSPDGKYIAYCSMARAGFEADKQRVMLFDRQTGVSVSLTDSIDRSASELIWSPDSKTIYFTASNEMYESIYTVAVSTKEIKQVIFYNNNSDIVLSPDGSKLYFKQERSTLPFEIFSKDLASGNINQLTTMNQALLDQIEMNPVETFWSPGAADAKVQSLIIKPPFFDATKKYPVIFLVHGGPQGHWNDDFHYRWNTELFASKGYVVVAPNPRGSTGYGQKFTDEISGDWGGKVYTDLMNAFDYALKNYSFIDSNNTFAAGASFGAYMMDWMAGHTNRFNAMVSHDGVFNLESMWGTTEELWFPEWELGGTPWQNRAVYEKFSPHRYIQNCKTPMLVVTGANDFRVCEEQAMQLFTSLQRLGVESKFLYFPDEYHFVTHPQNARMWWGSVFDWFEKHKK